MDWLSFSLGVGTAFVLMTGAVILGLGVIGWYYYRAVSLTVAHERWLVEKGANIRDEAVSSGN